MRAALGLPFALCALSLAACGGTSSETPWPIEPDERPLGPAAESNDPPAVVDPGPAPEDETAAPDAGAAVRKQAPPER